MVNVDKRVLLLTDSLGCPRKETQVEETWTDQVIRSNTGYGMYFYTLCQRGLHANEISCEYVVGLQPDIVIVQIGIVDACRRVFSLREEKVIRRIPILSKGIFSASKKYYYAITKRRNVHYSTIEDVKRVFLQLIDHTDATFCFLAIAPASARMRRIVYHIEEDVELYNQVFRDLAQLHPDRAFFLDPYAELRQDDRKEELFLYDGHHLSDIGIAKVFEAVNLWLEQYKKEDEI